MGETRAWWRESLDALQLTPLLYRTEHIEEIRGLPAHHSDPFDRALIAVAISEEMTMLSLDAGMRAYEGKRFRVIG